MHCVERRDPPRPFPSRGRAHLAWWTETGFRREPARLYSLTATGAVVALDSALPPEYGTVWIAIDHADSTEWLRAKIVQVSPTIEGIRQIGLRFADPFPSAYYEAILGPDGPADRGETHATASSLVATALRDARPLTATGERPNLPRTSGANHPTSRILGSFWARRSSLAAALLLAGSSTAGNEPETR